VIYFVLPLVWTSYIELENILNNFKIWGGQYNG
jgi:hypothetical protein